MASGPDLLRLGTRGKIGISAGPPDLLAFGTRGGLFVPASEPSSNLYATVKDVEARLRLTFDATSRPSEAEVEVFLIMIEAEMRGALVNGGYNPDPKSEQAKGVLTLYASTGAAVLVLDARREDRGETRQALHKYYSNWLLLVSQGNATGLETAKGESGLLPSSGYTKNPSSFAPPAFCRNKVQW